MTINDLPHGRGYYKKKNDNPHTQTKEISEKKKKISIEVMPEEIKRNETDTHFQGDSVIGVAKGTHNTLITLVNTSSQFTFIRRTPLEVFERNLKKKGIDTSFLDKYRIELPKCLVA